MSDEAHCLVCAIDAHKFHTFAKDFVYCVIKYRRPEWNNNDIFPQRNENSPFTISMRNRVWQHVYEHQESLVECRDRLCPDKAIDDNLFTIAATEVMDNYIKHTLLQYFDPERFFNFCMKISKLADEAITYEIFNSPLIAVDIIRQAIRELKGKEAFNEDSLTVLETFCEGLPYL